MSIISTSIGPIAPCTYGRSLKSWYPAILPARDGFVGVIGSADRSTNISRSHDVTQFSAPTRTIQHYGVEIDSRRHNGPALKPRTAAA